MNFFQYICHHRKVSDDLLIALNPEEDSTLSKLYCHRASGWPDDAKYPYRFSGQQAITSRERLPCGDYAVQVGGNIAALSSARRSTT